jgi:hypothetical protein
MSLSLTVAAIVLGDVALLVLLAFVMSRAALLTPHAPRSDDPRTGAAPHSAPAQRRQPRRRRATVSSHS